MNCRRRLGIQLIVFFALLTTASISHAEKIYRWVDKHGVPNATNDQSSIPPEYLRQALSDEAPNPAPTTTQGSAADSTKPSASASPTGSNKDLALLNQLLDQWRKKFERAFPKRFAKQTEGTKAPRTPAALAAVALYFVGSVVTIVGWVMLIIAAVHIGFFWVFLLLCCCPLGPLIIALAHWESVKKPFLIWLAGGLLQALAYALI